MASHPFPDLARTAEDAEIQAYAVIQKSLSKEFLEKLDNYGLEISFNVKAKIQSKPIINPTP